MDDVARRLGLTLLERGRTRTVYTVNYDSSVAVKIGYDKTSVSDSAREYENQELIKPFCTKCFEVSSTGTVGLFERVTPVRHTEEFESMAQEIFERLYKRVLGKYIMADIGMHNYMNYGFREGFDAVILDIRICMNWMKLNLSVVMKLGVQVNYVVVLLIMMPNLSIFYATVAVKNIVGEILLSKESNQLKSLNW